MTDNASDLPVSGNELNSKINLNFERILSQALRLALRDAKRVRAGNEPLMRIESEHSLLVLKSTCPRIEIELLWEDTVSRSEADEESFSTNRLLIKIGIYRPIWYHWDCTFNIHFARSVGLFDTNSTSNHDMIIPIIPSSTDFPPTLLYDDLLQRASNFLQNIRETPYQKRSGPTNKDQDRETLNLDVNATPSSSNESFLSAHSN